MRQRVQTILSLNVTLIEMTPCVQLTPYVQLMVRERHECDSMCFIGRMELLAVFLLASSVTPIVATMLTHSFYAVVVGSAAACDAK